MNSTRFILAVFVSAIFGCNSITDTTSPIEAKRETNGVIFTLNLSKNIVDLSDKLEGTFRVSNQSGEPRRFDFANMQQLGFRLVDTDGTVALFQPFIVSPALSSLQLQDGQSKEYTISTVFKDHTGTYVGRGEYIFAAFLLDGNSPEVTVPVIVK